MTPLQRGLAVALAHALLASGVAAKYLIDRARYPRAWAETTGFDPEMPIRGRYVLLSLVPRVEGAIDEGEPVQLSARDGVLVASRAPDRVSAFAPTLRRARSRWAIGPPVPFFLPEHAEDPTLRKEELWLEVTVPPEGMPRPLRLGSKRGDRIEPIAP